MSDYALLQQLAINVAVYGMAAHLVGRALRDLEHLSNSHRHAAIGLVLGATAVLCMLVPLRIEDGIVFDGRAIAVAAAGLFGGPWGAVLAAAPPAIYRIELGGAGIVPGVINIALAAALGAVVRSYALRRSERLHLRHVVLVGVLLPFACYLAFPFFPSLEIAGNVMRAIGAVLAIAMPVGFVALGLMLLDEERRAQTLFELRAKESLFDAVHAESPAMLFQRVIRPDGLPKFLFVSASANRLLDLSPEELYENPMAMISAIHPDDRQSFLDTIQAAERAGTLHSHEFRTVSQEGYVRWLRVSASAKQIKGERLWNGVTLDVTLLKQAERRNIELAQVFDDAGVAIIRTDAEFNVRHFNKAAEALYGHRAEDVIGFPAAMFRPPECVDQMSEFLTERRRSLGFGTVRTHALHKSGRRIPVRIDLSPLQDSNGALIGWAAICLDISDQARAETELAKLATTDPLTQLANRRSFSDRASQEITRARRYKRPLSVVLADIDHFKHINDTYGHAAGDEALKAAADVFAHTLRSSGDFVARLGGEEFAMLLPECNQTGAALLAERLRIAISSMAISHEDQDIKMRCSFGVAEWHPSDATIASALERADSALYDAKAGGRDQVVEAETIKIAATF